MPAVCCAENCRHSTRNCKLKKFPSDPNRAKIWERNCRNGNWTRKYHHRLCQCHFDRKQFQQNDNERLRPDAVPLLFYKFKQSISSHPVVLPKASGTAPVMERPPVLLEPLKSSANDVLNILQLQETNSMMISEPPKINNQKPAIPKPSFILPKQESVKPSASATTENSGVFYIFAPLSNPSAPVHTNKKVPSHHEETDSQAIERLKKEKAELQRENYRLRKKITDYSKVCRKFNDDELASLKGKKVKKWSDQTLNKCLETRLAIGKKGYDFLLKQGYPLVAYATLCRFIQKLTEENELSQNATNLLAEETSSLPESPITSSDDDVDSDGENEEDLS